MLPRVVPVLLIKDGYLVKPTRFSGGTYVGDPVNAVRIFNEKQVDELVLLDVDASTRPAGIDYALLEEIASEAFMPVAYGGGVVSAEVARRVTSIGYEKVVLNSAVTENPSVVSEIAGTLGSSSTVVSIDAKKRFTGGWEAVTQRATRRSGRTPAQLAKYVEDLGAGEIILSSVDREGTFSGYDLPLIESVASTVSIPVIALGGAATTADFAQAVARGASAVAAGSMFVLNGRHKAVLISYPSRSELKSAFAEGEGPIT